MCTVHVSIVLYKNSIKEVERAIRSCLNENINVVITLIDNSPSDRLEILRNLDPCIKYEYNKGANLGFGKAHNIAMKISMEKNIPYHLVLNPDVFWEESVIRELLNFMEKNKDVGLVMPKVLYPDGSIQYLCKLLPTPFDLISRRFFKIYPLNKYVEKRREIYELRFTGYNKIMEVPYLSGCFMFIRTNVLQAVGLFDERFFMYLEDTDLSRRIHRVSKTLFYPYVYIYHKYNRESYRNKKLLKIHIESAIKYFNKWGWFLDLERDRINKRTLAKLRYEEGL